MVTKPYKPNETNPLLRSGHCPVCQTFTRYMKQYRTAEETDSIVDADPMTPVEGIGEGWAIQDIVYYSYRCGHVLLQWNDTPPEEGE